MDIDDALWDLLDALHLGDFFEDNNIPPIIFPIAVIVVIALAIFFILTPATETTNLCGNGICNTGEDTNCPQDCTNSSEGTYSITLRVNGGGCRVFSAVIKDSLGQEVSDQIDSTRRIISFEEVSGTGLYAEVSSPESIKAAKSSDKFNPSEDNVVVVNLPSDYCGKSSDGPTPSGTKKGNLRVTLLDSKTSKPISGKVTLFDNGDSEVYSRHVINSELFDKLNGDSYYYLAATSTGYLDYDGSDEWIFVPSGTEQKKTIKLIPSTVPPEAVGKLEVCVYGDGDPIESSGEVTIFDVRGQAVSSGKLSDCPLFRGQASGKGCFVFTLPAGHSYYAQVSRSPSGCASKPQSGPFYVEENKKIITSIRLNCGETGEIRAIAYSDSAKTKAVTKDCKMVLYYKNGTKIKNMEMGNDNYTEYESIEAEEKVYVHAKNVPEGYESTLSDLIDIEAGDQKTATIVLTPAAPVSYDECTQPVKFKVGGIVSLLKLGGKYGSGASYVNVEYDKPDSKSYSLTDIEIPGITENVAGPTEKVESSVITLELDSVTGILSATVKCNLICGERGDLDGDGVVGQKDEEILRTILDAIEISGESPYGDEAFDSWPPVCLDIDKDGVLTEDDYICLTQNFATDCISCHDSMNSNGRAYDKEVCGDGYDNDCDGQTDKAMVGSEDLCDCTENTPCEMKRETIGLGTFDPNTADTCGLLSYKTSDGYIWHPVADWQCTSARESETLTCGGETLYCKEKNGGYLWVADKPNIEPLSYGCEVCVTCGAEAIQKYTCMGLNCKDLNRDVDCTPPISGQSYGTFTTSLGTSASCISGANVGLAQRVTFKSDNDAQVGMELVCVDLSSSPVVIGDTWVAEGGLKLIYDCSAGGGFVAAIDCNGDCSEAATNVVTCAALSSSPSQNCYDNDDGPEEYFTAGQVIILGDPYTHTDVCGGDTLYEQQCNEDGTVYSEQYPCPNGCEAGACVGGVTPPPTGSCTDSDDGPDEYVTKGYVTDSDGMTHTDVCSSNGITLYEQQCNADGTSYTEQHTCPNGCSGYPGACEGDGTTPPPVTPDDCDELDTVSLGSSNGDGCNSRVSFCGRYSSEATESISITATCTGQWSVRPCPTPGGHWDSSCDGDGPDNGWTIESEVHGGCMDTCGDDPVTPGTYECTQTGGLTPEGQARMNNGDLSDIEDLYCLQWLDLASQSVTGRLSSLSGLTKLKSLYLDSTSVTGSLSSLSGLTKLEFVNLGDTSVTGDISSLSGLTNLEFLDLRDTSVTGCETFKSNHPEMSITCP